VLGRNNAIVQDNSFDFLNTKKGAHLSHPLIHFQKLTKGSIKFEKELMVNVDGEIFTTDFLDFEVLPKVLRFAKVCDYRKK